MKKTDEIKPTDAALKRLAKALKKFKEQTDMETDITAIIQNPLVFREPGFVDQIRKAHKEAELKQQKCSACGSYEVLQAGSCVACTVCGESSGCG